VQFLNTKVVIFGQDPYHQPGLANGLAFAVNKGNKIPSSLKIFIKKSKMI
jgi:uracil-DNA glycosylase